MDGDFGQGDEKVRLPFLRKRGKDYIRYAQLNILNERSLRQRDNELACRIDPGM